MVMAIFAQAPGIFTPQQGGTPSVEQNNPVPVDSGSSTKTRKSSAEMLKGDSNFLGKDVPLLDSNMITWDGKSWDINNQRLFRARFEKYLNAPEQTSQDNIEYQSVLKEIIDTLSPSNLNQGSVDKAYALLPVASRYRSDASLCDSLANTIYSVWLSKKSNQNLVKADAALKREEDRLRWNAAITADRDVKMDRPPDSKNKEASKVWAEDQRMRRDIEMQPYLTRFAEIEALKKSNFAKREANKIQKKVDFQALLGQFFLQRRFQHVLIGTRFYRVIFGDGDSKFDLNKDSASAKVFSDYTGLPPTLEVLESLANEAIRDIEEGTEAFIFLMEKGEMNSATERLAEVFLIGEYMPPIRKLPREEKRKALAYAQLGNKLLSNMETKQYGVAEGIIGEMEAMASDFDSSKPRAKIETVRTVSRMHLNKAKAAAVSGQIEIVEEELYQATELWPTNPELAKVSAELFKGADVQQQALNDLDRLVSQKNFRQIYDDKVRYIAATAMYPEKQDLLKGILERMTKIEAAIIRAEEVASRGDHAGAWESVEQAYLEYKDEIADSKLSQVRANMTTHAPQFVQSIRKAQELEQKNQIGSSLAWYLQSRRLYPMSSFANEGIRKMVSQILPESVEMDEFATQESAAVSAE